jgi:hypothetical protein
MEQRSSWEAYSSPASQKVSHLSWNPNVHYRAHKSLLRSIFTSTYHMHLDLPSGLFPSSFPTKILYAFLISPACHTAHKSSLLCSQQPWSLSWARWIQSTAWPASLATHHTRHPSWRPRSFIQTFSVLMNRWHLSSLINYNYCFTFTKDSCTIEPESTNYIA